MQIFSFDLASDADEAGLGRAVRSRMAGEQSIRHYGYVEQSLLLPVFWSAPQ